LRYALSHELSPEFLHHTTPLIRSTRVREAKVTLKGIQTLLLSGCRCLVRRGAVAA
jgi:hypothetical protein